MRTFKLGFVTALVIAAGGSLASADTVNATFLGVSPGENVNVVLNGNAGSYLAGGFNWARDLGNPGTLAGFSPTFTTFCIDLTQYISPGTTYNYQTYSVDLAPTSPLGAMGPTRAGYMARLFADHYSSLVTNDDFAGFQLSVWEIAFDGDLSLLRGNFTASAPAGALATAAAYLGTVASPGPVWPVFAIDDLPGSNSIQGQMMLPTPGAGALVGMGGLAALRRRRR